MFTVRADSIGEWVNNLRAIATEDIGRKIGQIDVNAKSSSAEGAALSAVRETFPNATVTSAPQQSYEPPWNDAGPQTTQQYPPANQQLPGAGQRRCPQCNSVAEYKEGVNRSGKPYKGYFCTGSRDHNVQWVN